MGIFFSVLSLGYLIFVCCAFRQLKIAINVIDASADFIKSTKRIILVNIAFFFGSLLILFLCVGGLVGILSMGDVQPNTSVIPQGKSIHVQEEMRVKFVYSSAFVIFGILWIQAFLNAQLSFVVMVSATSYYFDSNSDRDGSARVGLGFKYSYRYHFGSLAFGSFVIPLFKVVRVLFIAPSRLAAKLGDGNSVTSTIFTCANCVLQCCEAMCDYLNQQAYAYMAVSGDRLCVSAWNGFLLNLKHTAKFAWANFLANVFILIGKLTVIIVNTMFVYLMMKYMSRDIDDVQMLAGPLAVVALATYVVTSIFLGIFDEVVLALMTCLAIDSDLNSEPISGPAAFHSSVA